MTKKITKQEIKEVLVDGLVDWLIVGLIIGLIYGLIIGLIGGLIVGLALIFTTQLIALITSNPKFIMFDFIVSGILIIFIEIVGCFIVWGLDKY